MTFRQATEAECADFSIPFLPINWAVEYQGEVAAIFQAQPDGDDWLLVHANAKRHTIHPKVLGDIARQFSDRLLELGAIGVRAEIADWNRAAIWLAKAAGYQEKGRSDGWVLLERKK